MITKTTYAMFAIVAVATLSFGMTPAFASSFTQTVNTTADNTKSEYDSVCSGNNLITRVTPNASSDYVKIIVDGDACSTFSSVTVTTYVDGVWSGSVTVNDDYKTIWVQGIDMDIGDSVKVVANWSY